MFRTLPTFVLVAALVAILFFPTHRMADDEKAQEKKIAEQASKYEYPGSKKFRTYNIGNAYQSVATTGDDLDKVDAWYRQTLSLGPTGYTGVRSATRIIDRETPKERGFDVLSSLFVNNQTPKEDDPKRLVRRTPTVRSHVIKEEVYTLVVVAVRGPEDKQTQVSVSYLPEAGK